MAAVVATGFCPAARWIEALAGATCGTGGIVDDGLGGVTGLRNANRLLPQHIVVSFRWLQARLNDEGFLAQPFE
jgi:hypothetical protein